MTETSDIDEKMLEIISLYINNLETEQKTGFLDKRRKKLIESTKDKIKKTESKDLDEFYYSFLFDSSQKWRTVLEIVKDAFPDREEITKLYDPEIIKIRNYLAHTKETKDESGNTQLTYKDFVFNEQSSKKILISLKKHEDNFIAILEYLKNK